MEESTEGAFGILGLLIVGAVGVMLILMFVLALVLGIIIAGSPEAGVDGGDTDTIWMHDSRDDLFRAPGGAVPVNTPVTLRFRAPAGELDGVTMRLYNTRTQSQSLMPMHVVATTPDGEEFWETILETGGDPTVYYYRFILRRGETTFYYEDDTLETGSYFAANEGGVGTLYDLSPDASYQLNVYDPAFYTPAWMRNGIIYQIFPDRFRDGDPSNNPEPGSEVFYDYLPLLFNEPWNSPPVDGRRITVSEGGPGYYNSDFFGGDLAGIIEKLDYLQSLGVTGIYLNPIFEARSNHRYDTADFLAIDPRLGTLEDFQRLVAEAGARGMHIILDGVFNHMSSDSRFFDRYNRFDTDGACESVASEWRSWFYFEQEPSNPQGAPCAGENGRVFYESWFGFDSIPKINNSIFATRSYFVRGQNSVTRTWGAMGIGGWRLDVAGDIDNGRDPENQYWENFREVVRLLNPEGVIIGEEWGDASEWLLGDEWDSSMNYRFRRGVIGFIRGADFVDNDGLIPGLTPSQFDNLVRSVEEDYPPMAYHAMMNLVGSHDTSRIFFVLDNSTDSLRLAAFIQFTLPGAPTIYYGDEVAIDAPSIVAPDGNLQDDPYNRAPYPWTDTEGDYYPPPNEEMLAYYQRLAQARHANPALREGEMITLVADDATGIYAFVRRDLDAGNAALVVMNLATEDQEVSLSLAGIIPAGLTLESVFSGETVLTDRSVVVHVASRSSDLWVTSDTSGAFARPEAPAVIRTAGQSGAVNVSWNTVEGASGYIVYRSPVAVGGFEPVGVVDAETTYVDTSVVNGFIYHYAVAAVSRSGLVSGLSPSAAAVPSYHIDSARFVDEFEAPSPRTLAYGLTVEVQAVVVIPGVTGRAQAVPGILAQAALTSREDDPAAEPDGWVTMQYVGGAGGGDVYSALLRPLAPGDYLTRVRFSADAGQTWVEAVTTAGDVPVLTVLAPEDTTAPATPESVLIVRASLSGVMLTWQPVQDESLAAYRVYRTDEDGNTRLVAESGPDTTEFLDSNVSQGERLRYSVTAVDAALNESAPVQTEAVFIDREQIRVRFLVTVPDYTTGTLYLAGDFGSDQYPLWDPAGLVMEPAGDNRWSIVLNLPEGAQLQFKFTRGNWETVEKGPECEEIANRQLTIGVDTLGQAGEDGVFTAEFTVAKWRDLDSCG